MTQAQQNVANWERAVSVSVGSLIIGKTLLGVTRKRPSLMSAVGLVTGAGLLWRGVTGHCAVYERLGKNTNRRSALPVLTINKSFADVERVLNNASAKFVHSGAGQYVFKLGGFAFEITIKEGTQPKQTVMSASLQQTHGLPLSDQLQELLDGSSISAAIMTELRNLKALVETGEIATTAGQAHGSRSLIGGMLESGSQAVREKLDSFAEDMLPAAHRRIPEPPANDGVGV